jgi:predicted transcriptional regulator
MITLGQELANASIFCLTGQARVAAWLDTIPNERLFSTTDLVIELHMKRADAASCLTRLGDKGLIERVNTNQRGVRGLLIQWRKKIG